MLRLKRETEADHRAVEDALPLFHAGLDTAQYVACLRRLHGVVAAWEERAAAIAPDWLQPSLIARRRKGMLELDLEAFGVTAHDDRRPLLPTMSDLPSLLGTMYVMEGSTLGGQLIARHVAVALHLEDGRGYAYFRGHGEQTGRIWKEYCQLMKHHVSEDRTDAVVSSAKAMFATFGQWMRQKPDPNDN